MKLLEEHLVEKYEGRFTIEQLVNEGIPKLFLKIEAVKKQIAKLEADRKKAVVPYNKEKDPAKREKLLNILKDLTKKINALRKNLIQMQDMEDKYVASMGVNDELEISEDIDLAVNRSVFGFEPPLGPEHSSSETQRKKRLDALERQSHEFIKTVVVPQLEDAMGQHIVPESFRLNIVQKKGQVNVLFDYPGTLKGELVGVLPDVLIELVPRADDVPNQVRTITPTLYEVFPEILGQGSFEVPVLLPERTFLEKLFFIHESLLGLNPDGDRKSRHYYDLHKMYHSGVFDRIKASPELVEVVIAHRKTFFRYNNLDYDRLLHFGVGVVPSSDHLARWRADYDKTIDLIYHDRPSFDDLMVFAQKLEYEYNTWTRSRSGFAGS
mgnify:CR=1 FL=1